MIDFAHEEVLFFLALLAFGNVLDGADKAHDLSLGPGALAIGKPATLHPTDLAVSPPEPVLIRVGLRIGGIERRLSGLPKPFPVRPMHPLHQLLKSQLDL